MPADLANDIRDGEVAVPLPSDFEAAISRRGARRFHGFQERLWNHDARNLVVHRLLYGSIRMRPSNPTAQRAGHGRREPWNRAAPFDLAKRVKARGIFQIERRLGAAVTALLAIVGLHGVAPEVPDESGRAIT